MKFKKMGGYLLVFLGTMHLLAHLLLPKNESDQLIIEQMKEHAITFLGEQTLWGYYVAFSVSMGILYIFVGVMITYSKDRFSLISTLVFLALLSLVAILYVHALAYGILLTSLVLTIFALKKKEYA